MGRCSPHAADRGRLAHSRLGRTVLTGLAMALLWSPAIFGEGLVDPSQMPGPLKEVSIEQRIGEVLPLDAPFVDETGRAVTLGDYFSSERPVILALVYYDCPMLCSLIMNGLSKSLGVLKLDVGEAFDVVAVSFAAGETPHMAREAKTAAIERYGRLETAAGWHFLTGGQESIDRLTQAVGFNYKYIPETGEYAHGSAIVVVTPEGQLAQYYYGVEYPPKDLRLALVEASSHRLGTVVDQILLYCFRYDPQLGKYTTLITRVLRIAGVVFCLGLATFLWLMLRRERVPERQPTSTLGATSR